jgi:cytochrome c oxidase cbb3-type subunit 3/ubiquinol-cytochrome c reductase cytochrome c subunit
MRGITLAIWLLASACSTTPPDPPGPIGSAEDGQPVYDRYCAFCHGAQGEGYLSDNANALAQPAFLSTATDTFLETAIIQGRPGTPMSPWGDVNGGPLSVQDARNVVAYIRTWQIEPSIDVHADVVEGAALRGQAAYNVHCAACHGEEGDGVTAMSLNNPWFLATASDGFIRHAIAQGRAPTPMPAYADILTGQVIDDLVVLIRSWATPTDGSVAMPFEPDLSQALLNPDGEPAVFDRREGRYVPAADIKAAMDMGEAFVLIDARPTPDYLESHIVGATSVPFYRIEEFIDELPRDRFIITYCGCPHAVSGQAADALLEAGFEQVGVLDEGYYFWEAQGWPVESGPP